MSRKRPSPAADTDDRAVLARFYSFHWFAVFNALFWTLIMSSPMILFVRALGAGRAWVGALSMLHVLLGAAQLPAAPYASRYGYKRLTLHTWISRTIVISIAPVLAFLPASVPAHARLVAFTAVYILFNALRGVGVTAFMPWEADVVPEPVRGRFFSRNQFAVNAASILTLFAGSLILGENAPLSRFGILFAFAIGAAWVSIVFLARCPAPRTSDPEPPLGLLRHLRATVREPAFMRIVWLRVGHAVAVAAVPAFLVLFLREKVGLSEGGVLRYSAWVGFIQVMAILNWGQLADRWGSRPLLKVAVAAECLSLVGWAAFPAGGAMRVPWLLALGAMSGFGTSGVTIAILRYAVNTAPQASKAVALALQVVVAGVVMFAMPVLWGQALDGMTHLGMTGGSEYRVFFLTSAALLVPVFPLIRRLAEPDLARTGQVLYFMVLNRPFRTALGVFSAVRHGVRWTTPESRR